MSIEKNKIIARRFIEALNAQDHQALAEVLTPKYCEEMESWLPWLYDTFGVNHRMDILELIAEGDQVWARLATSGSHTGEWEGIQPTGIALTNTGVYDLTLVDGRIANMECTFNDLAINKQLGCVVKLPEALEAG